MFRERKSKQRAKQLLHTNGYPSASVTLEMLPNNTNYHKALLCHCSLSTPHFSSF